MRIAKNYVFRVFLEIMKNGLKHLVAVTPSIVNFLFLDGDVPLSTSYGVYICQLIRSFFSLLVPELCSFLCIKLYSLNFAIADAQIFYAYQNWS